MKTYFALCGSHQRADLQVEFLCFHKSFQHGTKIMVQVAYLIKVMGIEQ